MIHKNDFVRSNGARFVLFSLLLVLILAASAAPTQAADAQWRARYWNNRNLSGEPVLRRDENNLDHDWGQGSPAPGVVNNDNFSARWTRSVGFNPGNYRFTATMDDGMRVWVDDRLIIDSWNESQQHSLSADVGLTGGDHNIAVEYFEAGGAAVAKLSWVPIGGTVVNPPIAPSPGNSVGNFRGEYYRGRNLNNAPLLVRTDPAINFNWGSGSPAPEVPSDRFSVRWQSNVPLNGGRYRFNVLTDDGVRLWVNNVLIIDQWHDSEGKGYSNEVELPNGNIPIKMEYYENLGDARAHLTWTQLSSSGGGGTVQPQPPATSVGTATVLVNRLNVRNGPGTRFNLLTTLNRGQTIPLSGFRDATGTWASVNYNGNTAWISVLPGYVSTTVPVSSMPVAGNIPAPIVNAPLATVGSRVSALNLRTGPNVSFDVIRALPAGSVVGLIGRNADNSWLQVRTSDGTVGWMSAPFLVTSVQMSSLPITG